MLPSAILIAARALIADDSRWCTEHLAVDDHGFDTGPNSLTACRWDAIGALEKIIRLHNMTSTASPILKAYGYLLDASRWYRNTEVGGVVAINDYCGHDAMVAMFDAAIREAEEEELAIAA